MGSYLRLVKSIDRALKKNKTTNTNKIVESEENKAYKKYLENISCEELTVLFDKHLKEYENTAEWQERKLVLESMSESEILGEIMDKLRQK
jgi:hypothetical protein